MQNLSNEKQPISPSLLRWYDKNARLLPWRIAPRESKKGVRQDPYKVWLSEIMLQQTTVVTVTPRFQRFLALWPNVYALADAPRDDVLAEWAGLGYYARARNLHKCAQMVVEQYDGFFPKTVSDLLKLPGIGPYTAAAISSIAFDVPAPVMDGNVERVMSRLYAIQTPLPEAKPVLKERAAEQTPLKRSGDHAQALMDLGAGICTPRNPLCTSCPVSNFCEAYRNGSANELPKKKKKPPKPTRYGTVFVIRSAKDHTFLLERRPDKGLLAGMLAFPGTEWNADLKEKPTPPLKGDWRKVEKVVRHTFTHFHLELAIQTLEVEDNQELDLLGEWVNCPDNVGLPTVFQKVFEALS